MISSSQAFWGGAFVFLAGALLGGLFFRWKQRKLHASRIEEEKSLQEKVRREAEATLREARLAANEEALKLREQTEKSFTTRRRELSDLEQRLAERESLINRQLEGLVQRENDLRNRQETLEKKEAALEAEREELNWLLKLRKEQLQKLSQLNEIEARALLLKEVEREALQDATDLTRHILDDARLNAEAQARRVISLAIQRYAGEHTFETTTATISLPNEEIKGRIIGREGRNIRAFEAATGITVLIDDTPNAVVLSGFDPVRREIARESMQRLILDGRIHPTRIEEVVHKVSQEMDETILRAGNEALFKVGLPTVHIEIVKLLLERGADPNLPEEGIAPHGHALYSAVYNGQFDIAKLLLEQGAYPSPAVESSADALSIAIMNSDQKMVDLLCSYGASRSVELLAHYGDVKTAAAVFAANHALADNPEALSSAAGNGHEGFVRLMLRYQPDLAKRVAVGAKTRELNELLFQHGMNPSQPDWLRITPLHEFARKNDLEKAAIFIDHGADLHARDEDICSTPLGWAAKFGNPRMVELLLTRGAKPNLPEEQPWATPLAWATRRGHEQVVRLLTEYEKTGALPAQNLKLYEALAKDFVEAYGSGDASAMEQIFSHFQPRRRPSWEEFREGVWSRLGTRVDSAKEGAELSLADAQFLVARWNGFESWADLTKHIEDSN